MSKSNLICGAKNILATSMSLILQNYFLPTVKDQYWESKGKPEGFRFLHISTDEVYGSLGDEGYFTEQTPYDPSSPYSA